MRKIATPSGHDRNEQHTKGGRQHDDNVLVYGPLYGERQEPTGVWGKSEGVEILEHFNTQLDVSGSRPTDSDNAYNVYYGQTYEYGSYER